MGLSSTCFMINNHHLARASSALGTLGLAEVSWAWSGGLGCFAVLELAGTALTTGCSCITPPHLPRWP